MYRTVKRVAFGTPHRRTPPGFADGGTGAPRAKSKIFTH